ACTVRAMPQSYQLILRYDGRAYFGWQRLRDKPTIQGRVEAAVETAFGERVTQSDKKLSAFAFGSVGHGAP
ncbi:MAG: hypothetical protein VYA97_14735, partial [Pseudomonadota bacterium]|nr:hypothetical protein [Pseudomonadota bacterium]